MSRKIFGRARIFDPRVLLASVGGIPAGLCKHGGEVAHCLDCKEVASRSRTGSCLLKYKQSKEHACTCECVPEVIKTALEQGETCTPS